MPVPLAPLRGIEIFDACSNSSKYGTIGKDKSGNRLKILIGIINEIMNELVVVF